MKGKVFRYRVTFYLLFFSILYIYFSSLTGNVAFGQENETKPSMTYASISVELRELDLSMRRITFELSGTCGLNFNSSQKIIHIGISTHGSPVGMTKMDKAVSGQNSSAFQINASMSEFTGYFLGGPETFPFDRYEFNFTLSFFLPGVEISDNDIHASCRPVWPLKAQFEGPLDISSNVTQNSHGPRISIVCALNRPSWRGYATLMPLYLIFALIGFTAILKTDSPDLRYRIMAYLAVITLAIGYNLAIQNVLPQGRYYLSFAEALIYGVIGSATIFLILAFTSYRMKLDSFFTDIIAGIFSIGLLSFLILTFYIAPYVDILTHHLVNIHTMEWTVSICLLSGVIVLITQHFYKLLKDYQSGRKLKFLYDSEWRDNLTKWIYWVNFSLNFCCLIITVYIVWIFGPEVELNMLRRTIFQFVGKNIPLMVISQLVLSIAFLLFSYYFPRRRGLYWLTDTIGIILLTISIPNFLNDFYLLPANFLPLAWLLAIASGVILTIFIWRTRESRGYQSR